MYHVIALIFEPCQQDRSVASLERSIRSVLFYYAVQKKQESLAEGKSFLRFYNLFNIFMKGRILPVNPQY